MSWAKWVGGGLGALVGGPVGAAIGAGLGALLDEDMESESQSATSTAQPSEESFAFSFSGLSYFHGEIAPFGASVKIAIDLEENQYTFDGYILAVRVKQYGAYVTSSHSNFADNDGDIFNGGELMGAGPYELYFPYSAFDHVSGAAELGFECVLVKDNDVYAKTEYTLDWTTAARYASENTLTDAAMLVSHLGKIAYDRAPPNVFVEEVDEALTQFFSLNDEGVSELRRALAHSSHTSRYEVVRRLKEYNINLLSMWLEEWCAPCRTLEVAPSSKERMWDELTHIFRDLGSADPFEDNLLMNVRTKHFYLTSYRFTDVGTALEVFFAANGDVTESTVFFVRLLDEHGELAQRRSEHTN